MADADHASSVPVVRARVNGRSYSFEKDSGRVIKGPRAIVGKYIAQNQLDRIEQTSSYYGHLFLADTPETRRLEEAAFALMEYREAQGMVTLVEGMYIKYNGMRARVGEMDDSRVRLHFGNLDRLYSREKVEREGETDYENLAEAHRPAPMFENEQGLIDPVEQVKSAEGFEGSVEIDTDDLADKVLSKLVESDAMDRLADKLAERISNTYHASGNQQEQATEDK